MFENIDAQLEQLNVELKKLEDTLSPEQKDQLDTIFRISSNISVSEALKREFEYSFESGAARMILQYVNGKFVLRMIK
jgi:hypothetical protein